MQSHIVHMELRLLVVLCMHLYIVLYHDGAVECQIHVVRCRVYSVLHRNDGHHKLIRWQFVIHAAIDGFSLMRSVQTTMVLLQFYNTSVIVLCSSVNQTRYDLTVEGRTWCLEIHDQYPQQGLLTCNY